MSESKVLENQTGEPEPDKKLGAEASNPENDVFSVEEIEIEEMAIDGICGVY